MNPTSTCLNWIDLTVNYLIAVLQNNIEWILKSLQIATVHNESNLLERLKTEPKTCKCGELLQTQSQFTLISFFLISLFVRVESFVHKLNWVKKDLNETTDCDFVHWVSIGSRNMNRDSHAVNTLIASR